MFKKDSEEVPINAAPLTAGLWVEHDLINKNLAVVFNAISISDINKSIVSGEVLQIKLSEFKVIPSEQYVATTDAYMSFKEMVDSAHIEMAHSVDYHGQLVLDFSVKDDFFSAKTQPVALLDAPKADALSDDLTQSDEAVVQPQNKAYLIS
jgi:hypothetical protein